jgi:predicted DNA-binding transcriptional regulator AlpA
MQDSYSYPPRGLNRQEAARYIGVGVTFFDRLVGDGRMPKPFRVGKRVIWDRFKVDAAFSGLDEDRENYIDRATRLAAEEAATKRARKS